MNSAGDLLVTRHADAKRVLRHPALVPINLAATIADVERRSLLRLPALRRLAETMVFFHSGDGHLQARRFLGRILNELPVSSLEPAIRDLVDRLTKDFRTAGGGDLVSSIALPLPQRIMGDMLGISDDDMAFLGDCATGVLGMLDGVLPPERWTDLNSRVALALDHLGGLLAERRRSPVRDGLSSMLALGTELGLDPRELTTRAFFLFVAGLETSTTFLSLSFAALLEHTTEAERWRRNEVSDAAAVEELLRFTSPVAFTKRVAAETILLGDIPLAGGQGVVVSFEAANRDPEVFQSPDLLELGRPECPHLAFGDGVHACLGASLARLQGRLALRAFLALPSPRLLAPPERNRNQVLRSLDTLAVALG